VQRQFAVPLSELGRAIGLRHAGAVVGGQEPLPQSEAQQNRDVGPGGQLRQRVHHGRLAGVPAQRG
jgi:hypothetical protein